MTIADCRWVNFLQQSQKPPNIGNYLRDKSQNSTQHKLNREQTSKEFLARYKLMVMMFV